MTERAHCDPKCAKCIYARQSVRVKWLRWILGCTDLHHMVATASGPTLGEDLSFCYDVLIPQSYKLSYQMRENRGERLNATAVHHYRCEGNTKYLVSAAS